MMVSFAMGFSPKTSETSVRPEPARDKTGPPHMIYALIA
jgi:hypothetical protein